MKLLLIDGHYYRLPFVFRDPKSVQFTRRTDQRNFPDYQDAAFDDQTFAWELRAVFGMKDCRKSA
jgi:hypothetical protein